MPLVAVLLAFGLLITLQRSAITPFPHALLSSEIAPFSRVSGCLVETSNPRNICVTHDSAAALLVARSCARAGHQRNDVIKTAAPSAGAVHVDMLSLFGQSFEFERLSGRHALPPAG